MLLPLLIACAQDAYFVDATYEARVAFRHVNGAYGEHHFIETMGPGVAFLDYDNDGYLDIYAVNGQYLSDTTAIRATNVLYRNNGDGTFTDVTEEAGVGDTGYGMGVTAGDYDNDGDLDIYITNYGPNVLYRNNGDGTFTDVTEEAGVGDDGWGVGCAFLDYDNDGYLDIYVANYVDFSLGERRRDLVPYMTYEYWGMKGISAYPHPDNFGGVSDVLYRNNGDGTFTNVTREAGVFDPDGKGMGICCGDYDGDGDVDIYVANDRVPNFLYRNEGDGTFTEVALLSGVAYNEDGREESSMGVDFGDYDNDGDLDIFVPDFQGETFTLYRNEGDGFFVDVSSACGIAAPTLKYVGWGGGFLDYDNDGDLDIFVATGHVLENVQLFDPGTSYPQRNLLFRNTGPEGGYRFVEVSDSSGPGLRIVKPSRGVAFGDYDNDGDVDILVINCNDTATLLRNECGNRNHWLTLKLVGTKSNRSGIGSRVRLISGDLVQVREVKAGNSLYSLSDLRVHFGLGRRRGAERIEIRWPSGTIQVLEDVEADRFITVVEPK